MNWRPKEFQSVVIGDEITLGNVLYFFGNRNSDAEILKEAFPELNFRRVHQVHGKDVCASNADYQSKDLLVKADAHWTGEYNVALAILTADCMPVLASDGERILAIHSGWRGTLLNIIGKSLSQVFDNPARPVDILIGPAIQKKSFEVGNDVAAEFRSLAPSLVSQHPTDPTHKAIVDLSLAARLQINAALKALGLLYVSPVDTQTTETYASHRRDRPQVTRNISFVAKLKSP